jgi:hypothetical protein
MTTTWLLTIAMAAGGASAPRAEVTPVYFPAGVADSAGAVGCVHTPEGGVEAVDLASGRRLWQSPAPSRALLIERGRAFLLEERGGRLRLSAYDPRTGRPAGTWASGLELPAWASLAEPRADRRWTTFDVCARRTGDALEVEYDARQQLAMGIPPGRHTENEARGVVRFEFPLGRAEHRPGQRLDRVPFVEPPPDTGLRLLRFHARAADAAIMHGGPPPDVQGVLVAGVSRIGFEKAPGGRGVRVRRWSAATRSEGPPLEIVADADAIWPTLDREHVALRRAHQQALCDVHSLVSGARIATIETPTDIAVIGGRLLCTTRSNNRELALVATEAGTGRKLWRRVVWREPPPGKPVP